MSSYPDDEDCMGAGEYKMCADLSDRRRELLAEVERLRGLLAEALDGWADELWGNGLRTSNRIEEIRREAAGS